MHVCVCTFAYAFFFIRTVYTIKIFPKNKREAMPVKKNRFGIYNRMQTRSIKLYQDILDLFGTFNLNNIYNGNRLNNALFNRLNPVSQNNFMNMIYTVDKILRSEDMCIFLFDNVQDFSNAFVNYRNNGDPDPTKFVYYLFQEVY